MRTSIATVSLSGSLSEKLAAIAAAGFDGVEIFENDLVGSPLTPEEIRRRAADLGLTIDLYQPLRDVEAVPADLLTRNLHRAERKFDLMRRLGAHTLLVCSNVSPHAVDDDALAADHLHTLATRAHHHGIRIAYEALAWGRHVNTYDHAWRLVRAADHPALGVCLDSFHILSHGSDPSGIETIPGEKIFFLQLADAPLMAMDVLQWSRHYRCFPGQGGFDLTALLRHVLNTGYPGPLSLEVFNDVFRQADAGRTAIDARRSLLSLKESAGVTTPPGAIVPNSVAFAELAVADSAPLRTLLAALGFTRTGRHRSGKPVELWEQGRASILLNTSSGGPVLAALGLETPDPHAAVQRAESLLAPVVPRRRADTDAPLDAVAAPDGTELFFCRTRQHDHPSWTDDFTPNSHDPHDSPAITHIDHVALTQPWHRFDEAALYYRSVLGLRPQESVELADPYGLFRSRAVANTDGTLRIVLNVAPAPGDQARPHHTQHLALATDDILATAHRLREHGVELLPIPANYYDDLAARYETLDPDTLDTLRSLDILYDQDEHGTFHHLYTVTYGHLFFEIVQRTGGYHGYGAHNATVRLAAQHTRQLTV